MKKCTHLGHLIDHATTLQKETVNKREIQTERGILVQNFVEGAEFSAEFLVYHHQIFPLGITAKHTTTHSYFIETGHDFPASYITA